MDVAERTLDSGNQEGDDDNVIGLTWLDSSKIARKAGHWQTAYSAMLQAQCRTAPYWFMESAKLIKATGEPLRALQELEHALRSSPHVNDQENRKSKAKVVSHLTPVLRLVHNHSGSCNSCPLDERIREVSANRSSEGLPSRSRGTHNVGRKNAYLFTQLTTSRWESGHFHLGHFQDECFKMLPQADLRTRCVNPLPTVILFKP